MSIEVKVPMLPESVSEATMLTWHKKVGDSVSQGDILVDLETDKVVLEVPAPEDGVIENIQKQEGDVVTAEEVIATLSAAGEASAEQSSGEDQQEEAQPEESGSDNAETKKSENEQAETEQSAAGNNDSEAAKQDSGSGESFDIKVPVLPESVTEATVQAWHVKEGDSVEEGQNLVDLETDKVVLEVPATKAGTIKSINAEVGDTVTTDQVLIVMAKGSASSGGDSQPAKQESGQQSESKDDSPVRTSPAARHLMDENNLSKSDVQGSGNDNRITKKDVVETINKQSSSSEKPAAEKSGSGKSADSKAAATGGQSTGGSGREETREPMTRIRQTIARRLVESQQNTAMLTTFNEVDLTAVMELRSKYKEAFAEKHGVKLGFMSFFVKACVEGLKKYPVINAYVDGTDILYHNYCDIGIAVSSPRGLVVPVVRNTENKNFAEIESDIVHYGQKAKKGALTMDEMTGGTFTITNGGIFGSMLSTPIINPPQSAILGMHAINERPVAVNGEVVIRPMMYIALSYDHRIIDGAEAVRFLVTVKESLEDPGRLLLSV